MTKIKSPRFSIDKIGMKKVWKGVLIGGAGLILTGLENSLPFVSFSDPLWASLAVMVNSTLANFVRKFFSNY
ncbi:hypothetical protein LCGC14_2095000 [marine sediment metagenome]|uniref:Holin n=1 Tax=marine sediment metagenome TaxID=412755 RepID=A0A0F9EYZ1_9ZZZZ